MPPPTMISFSFIFYCEAVIGRPNVWFKFFAEIGIPWETVAKVGEPGVFCANPMGKVNCLLQ